jgi:hypothetical protein
LLKAKKLIPWLVIAAGLLAYHNSFTSPVGRCVVAVWQGARFMDAVGHYEQAHVNLGFALAQQGGFDEAAQQWEIAL